MEAVEKDGHLELESFTLQTWPTSLHQLKKEVTNWSVLLLTILGNKQGHGPFSYDRMAWPGDRHTIKGV